jgi:DNA polymerase
MHVRDGKIYGPNGTWLDYTTLQFYKDEENGDSYWRVKKRHGWTKLYGGKLVENVVQYLARIVLSQAMLRIIARGFRVVTTSHDELVILIPNDNRAKDMLEWCRLEMARTPDWLPGIPLDAEAHLSANYSK